LEVDVHLAIPSDDQSGSKDFLPHFLPWSPLLEHLGDADIEKYNCLQAALAT